MEKLKRFIRRYWLAIPAIIYACIYFPWFGHLEDTVTKHYRVIHHPLDDIIPFCEVFIIPYLLWFAYVIAVVVLLFFVDQKSYVKTCIFMAVGMTLFLIISTIFPNGHHLRPQVMPRDNIFTDMIAKLYLTDTSTNIFPSIHVYNSIAAHLGIAKCEALRKYRGLRFGSLILSVSIILSTVLIKQHSVLDLFGAIILSFLVYLPIYGIHKHPHVKTSHRRKQKAA